MKPTERAKRAVGLADALMAELQQAREGLAQALESPDETKRDSVVRGFDWDMERVERSSAQWNGGGQINPGAWTETAAELLLDDARRGLPTDFEERPHEQRVKLVDNAVKGLVNATRGNVTRLLGVQPDAWRDALAEWTVGGTPSREVKRREVLARLIPVEARGKP